jgi:hypothetical protein
MVAANVDSFGLTEFTWLIHFQQTNVRALVWGTLELPGCLMRQESASAGERKA